MKNLFLLPCTFALFASLLTAGCKQEVSQSEAAKLKTEYVFGIVGKSNNNPVFQAARQGALDAARDLSEKHKITVRVDWRTPDAEDAQKQANYLEQLVLARVDGIGISCSDASRVTAAINAAVDAGVPVMTWDSDASQSKRFCYHGIDNYDSGRVVMEQLAKVLDGKGVVAILAGNQTAGNLQERVRGARDAAKEHPGIVIKDVYYHAEDTQSSAAKIEQVQTANPDITGWAMIGGWALFSDAILNNPRFADGKVKIVSMDALPQSLPYLRKGVAQVLLAQGVYQWGYRSVELLYEKAALGKEPANRRDVSPLQPLTKQDVDAYEAQWKKWLPRG